MKHRSAGLLATFVLLFGCPDHVVRAADLFVSPAGDDGTGDGSQANPWRTISQAMSVAASGDRILVAAGTYDAPAGESFPIIVADGVQVLGPADGTATVRVTGTLAPVFAVGENLEPTALEDLFIQGEGNLLEVFGNPRDLRIARCVLDGGLRSLNHNIGGGPARLELEHCTLLEMDDYGIFWRSFGAPGAPHEIVLKNNTITGPAFSLDGVLLSIANSVSAAVDFSGNLVERFDGTGLHFVLDQATTGTTRVTGLISGNEVSRCDGEGVAVELGAAGVAPALACFDVLMEFNSIRRNDGDGIRVALTATGTSNAAEFVPSLRGNLIEQNDLSGLFLDSREVSGGECAAEPDLGASAGDLGRNSLFNNDDEYATLARFDVELRSAGPITAVGNWWSEPGVFPIASSGIERHLFHQPDDPESGPIDFSNPLPPVLRFAPSTAVVGAASGAPVTVVAGPGTAFVPRAGLDFVEILVAGFPVAPARVSVAADGRSLVFALPLLRGVAGGPVALVIRNPAGQEGESVLILTGDSQGGGLCFLATAAYGDENAAEVVLFRRFRDECLAGNPLGRQLVRAYYAISPALAEAAAQSPAARGALRAAFAPLLGVARLWLEAPWALAVGALLGAAALRKRPQR